MARARCIAVMHFKKLENCSLSKSFEYEILAARSAVLEDKIIK